MSEVISLAGKTVALPDTKIETITPESAPTSVEGYWGGELSAIAVCNKIIEYQEDFDAFIIACFSDPGLYAARELTTKPIVGIAESSMAIAITLGNQFGILSPLRRLRPVVSDIVNKYGFHNRCAGIETVEISVVQAAGQSKSVSRIFIDAGKKLIDENYAEVIILGGAALAGLEKEMSSALGTPVLDPVKCAVIQAQALVNLGLKRS